MTKPRRAKSSPAGNAAKRRDERPEGEIFGWLLNLRALEKFLDRFPDNHLGLAILLLVYGYMRSGDSCYASQGTIADRLGRHRTTILKAFARLRAAKVIVTEGKDGRSQTIRWHPDWIAELVKGADPADPAHSKAREIRRAKLEAWRAAIRQKKASKPEATRGEPVAQRKPRVSPPSSTHSATGAPVAQRTPQGCSAKEATGPVAQRTPQGCSAKEATRRGSSNTNRKRSIGEEGAARARRAALEAARGAPAARAFGFAVDTGFLAWLARLRLASGEPLTVEAIEASWSAAGAPPPRDAVAAVQALRSEAAMMIAESHISHEIREQVTSQRWASGDAISVRDCLRDFRRERAKAPSLTLADYIASSAFNPLVLRYCVRRRAHQLANTPRPA